MRQQAEFDNATRCNLCRHVFTKYEQLGSKVRDHDLITGNFLCAAYRQCNLERAVSLQIPVFFQNFRGYDAHIIVHEFGQRSEREIRAINQNMEKHLIVQLGNNMVLLDSLKFLPASLEQLVASLAKTFREKFIKLHKLVADVSK